MSRGGEGGTGGPGVTWGSNRVVSPPPAAPWGRGSRVLPGAIPLLRRSHSHHVRGSGRRLNRGRAGSVTRAQRDAGWGGRGQALAEPRGGDTLWGGGPHALAPQRDAVGRVGGARGTKEREPRWRRGRLWRWHRGSPGGEGTIMAVAPRHRGGRLWRWHRLGTSGRRNAGAGARGPGGGGAGGGPGPGGGGPERAGPEGAERAAA